VNHPISPLNNYEVSEAVQQLHLKRSLFLVLIFVMVSINPKILTAQIVKVIDASSRKPISNVYLFSNEHSSITGLDGTASIAKFNSQDLVTVQHPAYENKKVTFTEIKENTFIIMLREAVIVMDDFVISANRWEQNSAEIPNQIKKIGINQVDFYQPQTTADLLNLADNVFIQKSQQGGGSPMIRGFSANRLLIVVDGVRMNTAIFRSGNLQNVITIGSNMVESAEIILGPGSVMYGSDALGGVMDFHTISPSFSTSGRLQTEGRVISRLSTANNERSLHGEVSYGFDKIAGLTAFSLNSYGDIRMGAVKRRSGYENIEYIRRFNGNDVVERNEDPLIQRNTAFDQLNFMQKISLRPSQAFKVDYGFHFSTTTDIPRYDRLIERRNGILRNAEWFYGPQVWVMHNFSVQHIESTPFYDSAKMVVGYQFFEESRNDRRFGNDALRNREEEVNALSINIDLDKKINAKNSLFYGFEWVTNDVRSVGNSLNIVDSTSTQIASRYPDNSSWNSLAAYLSHKVFLTDNLVMNSGLRFSYFDLQSELDPTFFDYPYTDLAIQNSALNGSVGLAWKISPKTQWSLNLSSGFRAPNVDDAAKVFDSSPGAVVVPNPDLEAEYAYNVEMAISQKIGDVAKLELAGFYSNLTNAMVRRPDTFNGETQILYDGVLSEVESIQNADKAEIYGIESSVIIRFSDPWSFKMAYTLTEGETSDGEPVRHVAPAFGSARLIYDSNGLKAELFSFFNAELKYEDLSPSERDKVDIYASDENGQPFSPGWLTVNARFSYELSDQFRLQGGVENIADLQYRPYSSGIVAAGRNFQLGVRALF
jgi:hemoglobin/transferrin/lactoferrin receptor protein